MFLSKIAFDRRRWDVVNDLEDRDRLHKKILKLFPDYPGGGRDNARELMGVLFRVEDRFIILQSKLAPEKARLAPGYTIEATKNVTTNYASIQAGRLYRFRLDANTSYAVREEPDADWFPNADTMTKVQVKSRRVGCGNFPARSGWFNKRCERHGFTAVDFSMDMLPPLRLKDGCFEATRFEGRLRVVRLEPFIRALHDGIGQGKAYGLGLLSLKNT